MTDSSIEHIPSTPQSYSLLFILYSRPVLNYQSLDEISQVNSLKGPVLSFRSNGLESVRCGELEASGAMMNSQATYESVQVTKLA